MFKWKKRKLKKTKISNPPSRMKIKVIIRKITKNKRMLRINTGMQLIIPKNKKGKVEEENQSQD